jgi:hypothetical protein
MRGSIAAPHFQEVPCPRRLHACASAGPAHRCVLVEDALAGAVVGDLDLDQAQYRVVLAHELRCR